MKEEKETFGFNPELVNSRLLSQQERALLLARLGTSDKRGSSFLWFILFLFFLGGISWGAIKIYLYLDEFNHTLPLFAMIPFVIVMAFMSTSYLSLTSGDQAGRRMRKDWRNPILYLRNTEDDGHATIQEIKFTPILGQVAPLKPSIEASAINRLGYMGPVVALAASNSDSVDGSNAARLNRLQDHEWQSLISAFIKISQAIVFVVGKVNSNIRWELNEAARLNAYSKVIFFVHSDLESNVVAEYVRAVKEELGRNLQITHLRNKSYYCMASGEHYSEIKSPRQIKGKLEKADERSCIILLD